VIHQSKGIAKIKGLHNKTLRKTISLGEEAVKVKILKI